MMPTLNYGLIFINIALVLFAMVATLANAVLTILLIVRRASPRVAIVIASPALFIYAAFAISMFWAGSYSPAFGVYFAAPVVTGFVVLLCAIIAEPTRAKSVVFGAAVIVMSIGAVMWWVRDRRAAFSQAVLEENIAVVRRLVRSLPVRTQSVRDRSAPLVMAANAVDVDIIRTIVESGQVDPNVDVRERRPLADAIRSTASSNPMYYRFPLSDEEHLRRQLITIRYLLDHGADPNLTTDEGTAVEQAWFAGRDDIVAILKAKGARDADSVPRDWNGFLAACSAGDVGTINRVLATRFGKRQIDAQNRSPLVEAAVAGQVNAVETLLRAYGNNVKCDLISRARDATKNPAISDRLKNICAF